MLTGIHKLMTYKCNLESDHCFLYSSPDAKSARVGFFYTQCQYATSLAIVDYGPNIF